MARDDDTLSASLQESLITLIAFNDRHGRQVIGMVEPKIFDPPYREIAERIINYRAKYKAPPGISHLDDLFDLLLEGKDKDRAEMMRQILEAMVRQSTSLNADYLTTRVTEFIRRQTLKSGITRASELYQQGGDNVADEVEQILSASLKRREMAMSPGIFMNDPLSALRFLDEPEEIFPLGIKQLDHAGIGPARKEMLLYVAARKKGKTWFLIHVGKHSLMRGYRVCHISLEMGEQKISPRYLQSMFSVAKRSDKTMWTKLELDEFGHIFNVSRDLRSPTMNFMDPDIQSKLSRKITGAGTRLGNLVVKDFPSGTLTMPRYLSYLDYLETAHNFVPDIVLLDYPDLMEVDIKNLRTSLGQRYVQLRGVASERNHAIVVPTQGNRQSTNAKTVDETDVSEDISKVATADTILTYSQTKAEKQYNLARILVAAARNDMDGYQTLISQHYSTGQFCVASAPVNTRYNSVLKRLTGENFNEDEED